MLCMNPIVYVQYMNNLTGPKNMIALIDKLSFADTHWSIGAIVLA